jgi:hypothetical protein
VFRKKGLIMLKDANEIKSDNEFAELIPPMSDEEYALLEKDIVVTKCIRDPLVYWVEEGILIDGYHRFKICRENNIELKLHGKSFKNRDQVKEWIIRNQLGRRNLSDYNRIRLADMLRSTIVEKAKEKQSMGGQDKVSQTFAEPVETNQEIANQAGVSRETVRKVQIIEKEATPEQKQQLRRKEKSINKVFKEVQKKKGITNAGLTSGGNARKPNQGKKPDENEIMGIFQTKGESENYHRLMVSSEDDALRGILYLSNTKNIPKNFLTLEFRGEWKSKPKK